VWVCYERLDDKEGDGSDGGGSVRGVLDVRVGVGVGVGCGIAAAGGGGGGTYGSRKSSHRASGARMGSPVEEEGTSESQSDRRASMD